MKKHKTGVFDAVKTAALTHRGLTAVTLLCVAASVIMSLIPPLLLARIIDRLTGGMPLAFLAVLLYFGSLVLESILSSAQEALLVLFGQKMTHALRSEMSQKLTHLPASTLAAQNPEEVAARFSGDVDTVEALFTSGIISMGGRCLPDRFYFGSYCREKHRTCADLAAGSAAVCSVYPSCTEAHAGSPVGSSPGGGSRVRAGTGDPS